ncbi:MAG: helix-turn-helix transcriptional regulator [Betaproteobacteria bacterium]|nr:helix-turn-helix transcriptional regulator [Betaproteobacteria bacterium]
MSGYRKPARSRWIGWLRRGWRGALAEQAHAFDGTASPTCLAGIEAQLVGALANLMLDEPEPVRGTKLSAARLADLEAWIDAHLRAPITVGRLCAVAGVGARALQKNFLSRRAMSPMRFVTERRLAEAHRQLAVPCASDNVTQIALRVGFAHLGRFATLYRQTFGESPIDTLRRARRWLAACAPPRGASARRSFSG